MRTTEKSIWLQGFGRAWKQLTIARGEAEGNSQLFPGLTESREPDGFFCWPRVQSVFVLLYHYMPAVNKIAIHKKLNNNFKKHTLQSKIYSNSRPLENSQFKLCNLNDLQKLTLFQGTKHNILKNNKNRPIYHNHGLSKTKRQTLTSL